MKRSITITFLLLSFLTFSQEGTWEYQYAEYQTKQTEDWKTKQTAGSSVLKVLKGRDGKYYATLNLSNVIKYEYLITEYKKLPGGYHMKLRNTRSSDVWTLFIFNDGEDYMTKDNGIERRVMYESKP